MLLFIVLWDVRQSALKMFTLATLHNIWKWREDMTFVVIWKEEIITVEALLTTSS